MISLKCPSLFQVDMRRLAEPNFASILHVGRIPSDNSMREMRDDVEPLLHRCSFRDGHGGQHLSTALMLLMFLALLIDRLQGAGCPIFQAGLASKHCRQVLWDYLRFHFSVLQFDSTIEQMRSAALQMKQKPIARPPATVR